MGVLSIIKFVSQVMKSMMNKLKSKEYEKKKMKFVLFIQIEIVSLQNKIEHLSMPIDLLSSIACYRHK
jgi:hypothetical protein